MNGPRDRFLSDAGLAFKKHGMGGFRRPLHEPRDALHVFAFGGEVLERHDARGLPLEPPRLPLQRVEAKRVLDRDLKPLGPNRLHHEIERPGAHGRKDRLDRAARRLHNGRDLEAFLAHLAEHGHAVEIGHDEIEDQKADRRSARRLQAQQRRLAALGELGRVAEAIDQRFKQPALEGIVVYDQNSRGHAASRGRNLAPMAAS